MNDWRPSASMRQLEKRAQLYQQLRAFFAERGILEIEAPVMGAAAVSDPFIEAIPVACAGRTLHLQTSPEYVMKRLLAAGSGAIYSLGKVFRDGERGRKHNPEFTLLEWYRPGWDEHQLMGEVQILIRSLLPDIPVQFLSYRDWFQTHLGADPHTASVETLARIARERIEIAAGDEDKDFWLDLLVTHELEAALPKGLTFVHDYPASQAALARLDVDARGQQVARRFEAFIDGVELANGYWELTDAAEQRARFEADQDQRRVRGLPVNPLDEKLLSAIAAGLPACAGVALGVDRLLMCLTGTRHISEVIAFDIDHL